MAIKEYESALPGCITFEQVPAINGNCKDYPKHDAVYLSSVGDGCYVNGKVGEWSSVFER